MPVATMTGVPKLTAEQAVALAVAEKLAQNAEAGKGWFPPDPTAWVAQPKWDGWRILAVVHADRVDFFSRSGKTYNGKLPHVEAEILANFPAGTVLDGEACAIEVTESGAVIDKWHTVQKALSSASAPHAAKQVQYAVFDLIAHGGIDARSQPYRNRRVLLDRIFDAGDFSALMLTVELPATEAAYEALVAQGFEGAVFKRLNAPYASGQRGHGWTKAKPTKTVDGVVMGFQPGKDGFAGMVGAIIFGQYNEAGILVERGKVSGMSLKVRMDMTAHPAKYEGVVIEVAHEGVSIGATDSGRFRFPRFKRIRDDRDPASVVMHDE